MHHEKERESGKGKWKVEKWKVEKWKVEKWKGKVVKLLLHIPRTAPAALDQPARLVIRFASYSVFCILYSVCCMLYSNYTSQLFPFSVFKLNQNDYKYWNQRPTIGYLC